MNVTQLFLGLLFTLSLSAQTLRVGLDVNDVSYLFPLKNGVPYPDLNLERDSIVNPKLFEEVLRFEEKGTSIEELPYTDSKFLGLKQWYLTAIRFETCGEVFHLRPEGDPSEKILSASQAPGCQPRLRLVAQPFNFKHPLANGLHLVFKLDPSTAQRAIQGLVSLKQLAISQRRDSSGPLMVHPVLRAEVLSGTDVFGQVLRKLILSLLEQARLEIVTLSIRVTVNHWKFVGGYVQENKWVRMVTEFSKQFHDGKGLLGVEEIDCDAVSVCHFIPGHVPLRLNPEGTVVHEIFTDRQQQVPGMRSKSVMTKAEVIDNPRKTNFFNTSCISCHQSSNLRDRTALHTDAEHPAGVSPFVSKKFLDNKTNNVINFGYFGSIARISTRTAADSAAVAAAINRDLGVANPAPAIGNLNTYWKCIVKETDHKLCLTEVP